jgi:hypothetical protein
VPINAGLTPSPFPDDLDLHSVPPEFRKEASDWFAVFNPKIKKTLDVTLVHTLMHERYVIRYLILKRFESKLFSSQRCLLRAFFGGRQVPCNRLQSFGSDL